MKKILSLLFLLFVGVSVYAQKSYITIRGNFVGFNSSYTTYLTGDIPEDIIKHFGLKSDYNGRRYLTNEYFFIYEILNELSAKGYEIEFVIDSDHYILSKNKEGSSSSIQRVRANNDSEPHEVARYNLQGRPVKSYEKGIQIIVFSNYTTKTVIVE